MRHTLRDFPGLDHLFLDRKLLWPALSALLLLCALLVYWRFLVFRAVASPIVIHDSVYGISSRTGNIIANASYIDKQPFDGITINIPATWGLVAPGSVWTYNDISPSWLER
jgi:hypothetical protein